MQKQFERAVALLHSFAYSRAEASFQDVARKDPTCAIAHWGVAMTHFHQLWDPAIPATGFSTGQREIQQARQMAASERERGFIEAVGLMYDANVPLPARLVNYEAAMKKLSGANREDTESQVFYALALLAAASPSDRSHSRQKQALEILEPLYGKYPNHPGIAHYLIHACDSSELARRGLVAARNYSEIAPSAPHALHMPSHIFTRLGLWNESIKANIAARAAAHAQGDIGEELHAMDYLVYADLQIGSDREARELIRELRHFHHLDLRDPKIAYAAVAMPVRYAVEQQQWSEAAKIEVPEQAPPQIMAIVIWARILGRAKAAHSAEAGNEIERLQQIEHALRAAGNQYWATQVQIQVLEASAWLAQAEKNTEQARELLRQAADLEDAVEKLPVTPGPIIPAREQLGELLLEQNQPAQAVKEFQRALIDAPGRRGSLVGLKRANGMVSAPTTLH